MMPITPAQKQALDQMPEVMSILQDPTLNHDERRARASFLIKRAYVDLAAAQADRDVLVSQLDALESLVKWAESLEPRLEPNECSRLHKLRTAMKSGHIIDADKQDRKFSDDSDLLVLGAHAFVVKHDWAKAFRGAHEFDGGDFHLPYEHCAFEFKINGRIAIVIAMEPRAELVMPEELANSRQCCVIFIQAGSDWWWCQGKAARDSEVGKMAWDQVRAISIALEAEVATHEVVRQPAALNNRRAKRGELPLYDYHVVSLARRHRATPGAMGGTHRSPRLHFRRGHWRHYDSHKTWIKWMLVGDPELGFVDKHYKL